MVYMLIGYAPGETHEARDYRRQRLRQLGVIPYPMPFVRSSELVGFQRWTASAMDKSVAWRDWKAARYQPRNVLKTQRRALPLFQPGQCAGGTA